MSGDGHDYIGKHARRSGGLVRAELDRADIRWAVVPAPTEGAA